VSTTVPTPGSRPQDVVERVVRQLVQTFGPSLLLVLTAAGASHDLKATLVMLAMAVVTTLVKIGLKLRSEPGDPIWKVILDRAGSAFAGVLAGAGVNDLTSLLSVDWNEAFAVAGLAAATALVMFYLSPPSNPPSPAPAAETTSDAPADPDSQLFQSRNRDSDFPYSPGATDRL
jgi:hypothetical protein